MRSRHLRSLVVALAWAALAAPAAAASPPAQPRSGAGGVSNPDAEVVKRAVGRTGTATYVYHLAGEPAEPRTVVVVFHGWGAVNPMTYGGWIDHLARRGHLVLFPSFQQVGRTRPVEATAVAAGLVKDALAELRSDRVARPNLDRVAYLGHSAGAAIAVNLAATARARELPVPRLVFATMPGGIASDEKARGILLEDLGGVDPATAIVTMIGDREFQAADRASRRILREASNVPPGRKLFMRSGSDDHGFPSLAATLASPGSPKEAYDVAAIKLPPEPPVDPRSRIQRPKWSADMVLTGEQQVLVGQLTRNVTDTLDYLAYWKTFDMTLAAVAGGSGDFAAVRSDPAFVDMGRWSDGWPVRRLYAEVPKAEAAPAAARLAPSPTKMPVTNQRRQSSRSR